MLKRIFAYFALSLIVTCAAAQKHPWLEQQDSATRAMLEQYGASEEYLSMQDKMLEIENQSDRAAKEENQTRLIILGISLLAAAWPVISGIRMISNSENKTRGGVIAAIGILLAGAGVLFALNYGTLMLRHKEPALFNFLFALIFVIALIVVAILMLRKDNSSKSN